MGHDVKDLPFILKWLPLSWTTFAVQGLGQKPPEKVQNYFTASILLGGRSWWQNGYLFGISTSTPHQAALSPLSFAESISGWNTVEYAPLFASYDWEWQPAPDILSDIQPNFFKIKTRNESFKPGLMVIPDFSYLTISISSNK